MTKKKQSLKPPTIPTHSSNETRKLGTSSSENKKIELIFVIIGLAIALAGGIPGIISFFDFLNKSADMTFNLNTINIGYAKQNDTVKTMCLIDLTISNKGQTPLTPTCFTLKAKLRNEWINFQIGFLPENVQYFSCSPQNISINLNKSINLNSYHEPISYGLPISGYLFFVTDSNDINKIKNLEITAFDIFENKYTKSSSISRKDIRSDYSRFRPTMSNISYLKDQPMTNRDSAKLFIDSLIFDLNQNTDMLNKLAVKNKSFYYPEYVCFIIGNNGTAILFDGESDRANYLFEFHRGTMPVQEALFQENIDSGSASIGLHGYIKLEGITFFQKKARNLLPTAYHSMEGYMRLCDRFFDISTDTYAEYVNCTFAFVRRGDAEIHTFPFIYITSLQDIKLLSKNIFKKTQAK
jgi:hypothetical protein